MIKGLTYIPLFLSKIDQDYLVKIIDQQSWLSDLKRRTQQYGYKYDYTKKVADRSMYLGSLPDWIDPYLHRLVSESYFNESPDQVIVNEYQPGQGIGRHADCIKCFGDIVASLSLGSSCAMDFERIGSLGKESLILEPGSLLVLSGEARYHWMHTITARKSDIIDNVEVPRERRLSLTFRNMIL